MSDKYYFCGNLPELTLQSDTPAEFTLRGVDVLITEKYSPDKSGTIKVSLRDIVKDILPPLNMMATQQAIRGYRWELGNKSGSFRVIPGGHAALDGIPADGFLANNFLTWQPQSCLTTHSAPQWLTYVAQTTSYCYLKGYFSDGSTQQVQLRAILPSIIHSFDVSYATVCSVLGKNPTYYDVVVDDGTNKTYTQRYILRNSTPDDDVFIFENSLGGYDTIILSGGKEYIDEIESQASVFGDETLEYDIKANRTCKKYTGYIANNNTRLWTLDFFNSINRYHVDEGAVYRVVITKPTLKATSGELAGYDFIFARAKQTRFLNLPRIEDPELLEIVDPADNLFFLAPRLSEFAAADPEVGDVIFPVQYAYGDKWLHLRLDDILNRVKPGECDPVKWSDIFGKPNTFPPSPHTHTYIDISNLAEELDKKYNKTGGTIEGDVVINGNLKVLGSGAFHSIGDDPGGEGGDGSGLDYDALKNLLTGVNGTPFNIATSFLGSVNKSFITAALGSNAYAAYRSDYVYSGDSRLVDARPASDVYAWAKAAVKPSYTWTEIGGKPSTFVPSAHSHAVTDVPGVWHSGNFNPDLKYDKTGGTISGDVIIEGNLIVKGSGVFHEMGSDPGGEGDGSGLDYDALKNLLTGVNGVPFSIATSFLGSVNKSFITAALGSNAYAAYRSDYVYSGDSRLVDARPASDVYAWAKAAVKPSYTWTEIGGKPSTFVPSAHSHAVTDVPGVWHSGNFNPDLKYDKTGGTISGDVIIEDSVRVANGSSAGTYIELSKHTGSLPGNPQAAHPTIKTDHDAMYFSVLNTYVAHISGGGANAYFGLVDAGRLGASISTRGNSYTNLFGGNFGIGTSSPREALEVAGNAMAKNLKLTGDSGLMTTIGSLNARYCHYSTEALIHWFNKSLNVLGDVYAGEAYNRRLAYADQVSGEYHYMIDATGLNQDTYYPVVISIEAAVITSKVAVYAYLGGSSVPSWATHGSGFSVRFREDVNSARWGGALISRSILEYSYMWTARKPIGKVWQMTNSSKEVIWILGGGRYEFVTSYEAAPELKTSAFTLNSQTVAPESYVSLASYNLCSSAEGAVGFSSTTTKSLYVKYDDYSQLWMGNDSLGAFMEYNVSGVTKSQIRMNLDGSITLYPSNGIIRVKGSVIAEGGITARSI